MSLRFNPWHGDPADPACPWTEDYNPETIMEAYEDAAEREAEERREERFLQTRKQQ